MSETDFLDFYQRLRILISKNPQLIVTTLSNIFTMRLVGNKTHGDLAEIGIAEFINQFMYDFKAQHVGKDLFRAKEHEEDILVTSEVSGTKIPISLKAYGDGPLQLSTDKTSEMFTLLSKNKSTITDKKKIAEILSNRAFTEAGLINVLPLIYDEKNKRCNIMVFSFMKAVKECTEISFHEEGSGRKHPVFRFYGKSGAFIMEVRYGGATANALQRGLWTHTKNALPFFDSVTNGWIDYSHNMTLVDLFSKALVATEDGHREAVSVLELNIEKIKKGRNL
jgi:hypothetical protein